MPEHPIPRWIRKQKRYIDISEYKRKTGCVSCPEKDPEVLDFHHRDGAEKESTITKLIRGEGSEERLWNEIAKCDVICTKCHRKLHRQYERDMKLKTLERYRRKYPKKFSIYREEIEKVVTEI